MLIKDCANSMLPAFMQTPTRLLTLKMLACNSAMSAKVTVPLAALPAMLLAALMALARAEAACCTTASEAVLEPDLINVTVSSGY